MQVQNKGRKRHCRARQPRGRARWTYARLPGYPSHGARSLCWHRRLYGALPPGTDCSQHGRLPHDGQLLCSEPTMVPIPEGYSFNERKGYWTNNITGEVMMLSDDRRLPASKKCDRETGEDQKGE